jgi:AbrB family looped-hinge helix DNA binding protein
MNLLCWEQERMPEQSCKVDNQGRITLPLEWRKKLGVRTGSEVILRAGDHGLQIQTSEQALDEARQIVALYWRSGETGTGLLRRERQRESEMEERGGHGEGTR